MPLGRELIIQGCVGLQGTRRGLKREINGSGRREEKRGDVKVKPASVHALLAHNSETCQCEASAALAPLSSSSSSVSVTCSACLTLSVLITGSRHAWPDRPHSSPADLAS